MPLEATPSMMTNAPSRFRSPTPQKRPAGSHRAFPSLTEREREVLGFLARGLSYEQTGLALDISINTVRSHVRALYEKLSIACKAEAVLEAVRLGLLA